MEYMITAIMTGVGGFITFLLGVRKGKAETEGVLLLNLEKSINIYQIIIEDMRAEIQALNGKIDVLEKKVETLLYENLELKTLMRDHDAHTNTKKK